MEKITSALRRIDLSQNEQDIYLSLLREGRATARTLSLRTGITRPSVYDQLKTLTALNLVVELAIEGKTHFAATDIKYLDALLEDKIDRLKQSREFLAEALPTLIDSLDTVTPKIRFFEGQEAMKQILKDIMWHDTTQLQMLWSQTEMEKVFDGAFLKWFDERRQIRKLSIALLIPYTTLKKNQILFTSGIKDTLECVPKGVAISMSTIMFGNKVAFISSHKEAFGFIVESKEFATLEKIKFDILWRESRG